MDRLFSFNASTQPFLSSQLLQLLLSLKHLKYQSSMKLVFFVPLSILSLFFLFPLLPLPHVYVLAHHLLQHESYSFTLSSFILLYTAHMRLISPILLAILLLLFQPFFDDMHPLLLRILVHAFPLTHNPHLS